MGNRRKAREASLQYLYEMDLSHKDSEQVFSASRRELYLPVVGHDEDLAAQAEIAGFARQIVEGVAHNRGEIDRLIESHSTHWKISRMALVDRNILRMAVFELLYCSDIPASVTLNEAIEVAKKFGTEESGSFVNGVLDHIAKDLKKV